MANEILSSLREAAKALRSGGSNGGKIKFGKAEIKGARQSLHMTQEQFADKVGVSVQTVRSWEQGDRTPGALSLAMLGDLLSEVKKLERV
jgi:putative transcriptional regulator